MKISWDSRPVFFKPFKLAYFLAKFALVPPLQNLRKWAIWVSLRNLSELGFAGTFGAAVCAEKLPDDCALTGKNFCPFIVFFCRSCDEPNINLVPFFQNYEIICNLAIVIHSSTQYRYVVHDS